MIDRDASLGHDLLEVAIGHAVAKVEKDRVQDRGLGKVGTFE
jgi:hypothetical protein